MYAKIFESEPPLYRLPSELYGIPDGIGLASLYNPYLVTAPRVFAESISSVDGVWVKRERTPYSDFTIYLAAIHDFIYWPSYNFTVYRFDGTTGAFLDRTIDQSLPYSLFAYQIFQARDGSLWQSTVLGYFFEVDPLTFAEISGTRELPAKYGAITLDRPLVDRAQNLVVMAVDGEVGTVSVWNFATGAFVRRIAISGVHAAQIFAEDATRCYVLCTNGMLNLIDYSTGECISTLRAPEFEAASVNYALAWDRYLRRLLVFTTRADDTDGACLSTLSGYYPVPLGVSMTVPIPLRAPRANRRTPFLCRVYGDAGEGVPGVKITPAAVDASIDGAPPFTDSDGEALITLTPEAAGSDTLTITADV